jgi:hypothetical protein
MRIPGFHAEASLYERHEAAGISKTGGRQEGHLRRKETLAHHKRSLHPAQVFHVDPWWGPSDCAANGPPECVDGVMYQDYLCEDIYGGGTWDHVEAVGSCAVPDQPPRIAYPPPQPPVRTGVGEQGIFPLPTREQCLASCAILGATISAACNYIPNPGGALCWAEGSLAVADCARGC